MISCNRSNSVVSLSNALNVMGSSGTIGMPKYRFEFSCRMTNDSPRWSTDTFVTRSMLGTRTKSISHSQLALISMRRFDFCSTNSSLSSPRWLLDAMVRRVMVPLYRMPSVASTNKSLAHQLIHLIEIDCLVKQRKYFCSSFDHKNIASDCVKTKISNGSSVAAANIFKIESSWILFGTNWHEMIWRNEQITFFRSIQIGWRAADYGYVLDWFVYDWFFKRFHLIIGIQ